MSSDFLLTEGEAWGFWAQEVSVFKSNYKDIIDKKITSCDFMLSIYTVK
jgi:archaellum biogenesis protein FlaJ (TadC family)